jgi:hypothetical protein
MWVNFASGGVTGLVGDGKIVLGITLVAIAVYIRALIGRKGLIPVCLGVQVWGTLAVFWMGALIWKVGSILASSEIKRNPFAGLFAMQISPGTGLYVGLIGGLIVAGGLAFLVARRFRSIGSLKPYYATQAVSVVLGILLAFFVSRGHPWTDKSTKANRDDLFPSIKRKVERPKEPREWYHAEWSTVPGNSRELKRDLGSYNKPTTYRLILKVWIQTEPDLPIKELHGHLAFVKDKKTIYEVRIAEKSDVSYTDSHLVWIKIDPYDVNNETHKTLRYAKDDELTPVFTVSKVVLADGEEKNIY